MKKGLFALAGLLVLGGLLLGVYRTFAPSGTAGDKQFVLEVVHGDGSVQRLTIQTDRAWLGEALRDEGLIDGEEGPYGMFIKTVDGETADESRQEWWCLTRSGGTVNTSADDAPIADGDQYELTLMVGY